MKFYKNMPFKPRLGSNSPNNAMLNHMRWLEEVGCTVLNHIKQDKLLKSQGIVKVLDAAGRKDLIPGIKDHELLSSPKSQWKASWHFGEKMRPLFAANNQLFPGNIMVVRLFDQLPEGKKAPWKRPWFHFVPSPDYFVFGEGGLRSRKR